MTMRGGVLPLVLALLLGSLACSHNRGLSGLWVGSFSQVAQERSGAIRLDLSQSGTSLSGRWEIILSGDLRWEGRLDGVAHGVSINARLMPDDPEICPYAWTATRLGDRLEGPYAAYDCRVEIIGRIDTHRQ